MSSQFGPAPSVGVSQLPPCHSRRDFDPAAGRYFCEHPQVHAAQQLVTAAICEVCAWWRAPPPAQPRPYPAKFSLGRSGPCLFLGSQTGERDCPTCRGNVRLKTFDCHHPQHAETTLPECGTCGDYEPTADLFSSPD